MLEFNATFLVSMISFVVFIMIMDKIFYKPILNVINQRQSFIDGNYSDAKNSKDKAESLLNEKEQRLNETLLKSKKLVADKTEEANQKSQSLTVEAKTKSQEEIEKAKEQLKKEENQTTDELKTNVKDLAENISSKLLGNEVKIDNIDYEFVNKVLN